MGFWGLEMVLKTFLKFHDIEGFASQQINGLNQYEKILLEIGRRTKEEKKEKKKKSRNKHGLFYSSYKQPQSTTSTTAATYAK
jgi:hypothetical protein